ncbi:MAG: DUF11 domain-containing protein [Thermoanaerobaculales bacterium]|nr:DUF11 domain-containing protein [Thermoanaerobaculales bacterium]
MAAGACLLLVSGIASADDDCTKFFQPPLIVSQPSWHDPANWSPVGVPDPTDVACLYEAGIYEVQVTQPVTIAGLRFDVIGMANPKLKIIATDFTLNGPGYLAGDTKLKVNDGAVLGTSGGGALEVHSKLVIEGGTVAVDVDLWGHLNWWGPSSLTGALTTHPGSVIEVEEPMMEAHLSVAQGFTNHGAIVLNDIVTQSLTVTGGGLVNAAGATISTSVVSGLAVPAPELRGAIDNNGLVAVAGLDLRLQADGVSHLNGEKGTIEVADAELELDLGGVLDVPSNFTNYGTTTAAGGGTIRVIGSAGATDVPSNFTNYGTTTVANGGTIRVIGSAGATDSTPMTFLNAGDIDIAGGGAFELVNAILDNPVSGRVLGDGTLDLTLAAGATFDGTLSPGHSPGVLTVAGEIAVGPGSRVAIEVGGEQPGVDLDRLDVTGVFGAGGTLDVSLAGLYQPAGGERYQVLTFGGLSGWFDDLSLPPLGNLLGWAVDVGATELALDVVCQGTELGLALTPDRDPVSVGHEVVLRARVDNGSAVPATGVVVSAVLPSELVFRPDLSSPGCVLTGATVDCTIAGVVPGGAVELAIGLEPVVVGDLAADGSVGSWECDTEPADNQATGLVRVVAAEPCDADGSFSIDGGDLAPAAGHIFGAVAPGNPDCRVGNGVTADDLAAIIDAAQ